MSAICVPFWLMARQVSLWAAVEMYALEDTVAEAAKAAKAAKATKATKATEAAKAAKAAKAAAAADSTAADADADADAAGSAPLPKMTKGATEAVRRFHSLIVKFRQLASSSATPDGASGAAVTGEGGDEEGEEGEEGEQEDGEPGNVGEADEEGEGEQVRLRLVSSELRRRFRTVDTAEAIGVLSGYEEGEEGQESAVVFAEAATETAAVTAASDAAESGDGDEGERLDGTNAVLGAMVGAEMGGKAVGARPSDLSTLFRMLLAESGYEALVKADVENPGARWKNLGESRHHLPKPREASLPHPLIRSCLLPLPGISFRADLSRPSFTGELANLARERRVDELDEFLDQASARWWPLTATSDALALPSSHPPMCSPPILPLPSPPHPPLPSSPHTRCRSRSSRMSTPSTTRGARRTATARRCNSQPSTAPRSMPSL